MGKKRNPSIAVAIRAIFLLVNDLYDGILPLLGDFSGYSMGYDGWFATCMPQY